MKVLLSGNEAIARGAFENGVKVAAGYPGTPSTEILENLVNYEGVSAQWSPNEKVALEVGIGSSIAGARTLVTMKHVGVNVAADPLFTFAYTGVNGGLVLISADDPGMHSSQDEQDNRNYAHFAKIALLEPSDSQEAKDMVGIGLEISEKFDTPVILRTTTRVNHSKSLVELAEPKDVALKPYIKNPKKYVMMPGNARLRRVFVEERTANLRAYSETTPLNFIEWGKGNKQVGIITSGASYQYVKEALPGVSVLKLGMTNPLPMQKIKDFAQAVENLFIVEELDPFLETQIKAEGIKVIGKEIFPNIGEVNHQMVAEKILAHLGQAEMAVTLDVTEPLELTSSTSQLCEPQQAPMRPPVMCPGCPHRGVFYTLKKLKVTVTGDIGCYTLGALAPLEGIDTTICMGASIGNALGMEKANPELKGKLVAVIGDSTFFHSGMTGLLDVVYNGGTTTTLILDNRTTGMTGHQDNPGTGQTLGKAQTKEVDIEKLVRALGVDRVKVVDPQDLTVLKATIAEELAADEPSVIITKRPCALLIKANPPAVSIKAESCTGCKACIKLGCPALVNKDSKVVVNDALCTGCELCIQVCKFGSIKREGENNA